MRRRKCPGRSRVEAFSKVEFAAALLWHARYCFPLLPIGPFAVQCLRLYRGLPSSPSPRVKSTRTRASECCTLHCTASNDKTCPISHDRVSMPLFPPQTGSMDPTPTTLTATKALAATLNCSKSGDRHPARNRSVTEVLPVNRC